MRRKALILCTAILLSDGCAPRAQRGAADAVTAIVGARLVDGTGAPAVDDSVILVSGDRITAAGPRARVQVPQGATVVNAVGQDGDPRPDRCALPSRISPQTSCGSCCRSRSTGA